MLMLFKGSSLLAVVRLMLFKERSLLVLMLFKGGRPAGSSSVDNWGGGFSPPVYGML
jgi:hypothetical protein